MVSVKHQFLVELFRTKPGLGPQLLNRLFEDQDKIASDVSIKSGESVLDQKTSKEYRADLLLEVRNAANELIEVIILEVQRRKDKTKLFRWPVYFAHARAFYACEPTLLVLTLDEKVASWANRPIRFRRGQGSFRPVVLGPSMIPKITDPATADKDVELAVLSALAHGNSDSGMDVVSAALQAAIKANPDNEDAYLKIIYESLGESKKSLFRSLFMENLGISNMPLPAFAQELINRGKVEGLREGKLEGKLEGKRDTLFRLLDRVRIPLSDADRLRIENCTNASDLDAWIENVVTAKNAGEVLT